MRRAFILEILPLIDSALFAVLIRDLARSDLADVLKREFLLLEVVLIENADIEILEPRRDFADPVDAVIVSLDALFERDNIIALTDEFTRESELFAEEREKRDKESQRQKAYDIYDQFGLVHTIPYLCDIKHCILSIAKCNSKINLQSFTKYAPFSDQKS